MIYAHDSRPLPEPEQEMPLHTYIPTSNLRPKEPEQEMPQCLEERPVCKPSTEPIESEEQLAKRKKLEILKRWDIGILPLDRGCIVKVGCKSIAFTSLKDGYRELGRYLENPRLVASEYGFGEHLEG